jgi:hypothetical protein
MIRHVSFRGGSVLNIELSPNILNHRNIAYCCVWFDMPELSFISGTYLYAIYCSTRSQTRSGRI